MERVAVLADVHGNAAALAAVLKDVRRQGVDGILLGGDYVLFGPRPGEAVDLLRSLDAPAVVGNTDAYLFQDPEDPLCRWTRGDIGEDGLRWLENLPFGHRLNDLLLVHANPTDLVGLLVTEPNPFMPFEVTAEEKAKELLGDARADLVVYGHIHWASQGTFDGQRVASVGSVGFPSDGDRRAAYGIAQFDGAHWQLSHRRVAYDHRSVAREIRESGTALAEPRAQRIEKAAYVPLRES